MDKILELRLIEEGYDLQNKEQITLGCAGLIIKKCCSQRSYSHSLVLFDGLAQVTMQTANGGYAFLSKDAIGVQYAENQQGLYIYSLTDRHNLHRILVRKPAEISAVQYTVADRFLKLSFSHQSDSSVATTVDVYVLRTTIIFSLQRQ